MREKLWSRDIFLSVWNLIAIKLLYKTAYTISKGIKKVFTIVVYQV